MIRKRLAWLLAIVAVAAGVAVAGGQVAWTAVVRAAQRQYHLELSGSRATLLLTRLHVRDVTLRYPVTGGVLEAAAARATIHLSPRLLFGDLDDVDSLDNLLWEVTADNPVFDFVTADRGRPVLEPLAIQSIHAGRATLSLKGDASELSVRKAVVRVRDVAGRVGVWCRDVDVDIQATLGEAGISANGQFRMGSSRSRFLDLSGAEGSLVIDRDTLRSRGVVNLTKRSTLRTDLDVRFGPTTSYEVSAAAETVDLLDFFNATIARPRSHADFFDWPDRIEPVTLPVPVGVQLHLTGSATGESTGAGRILMPGGTLPDLSLLRRLNEELRVRSDSQAYEKVEVPFSLANLELTIRPTVIRAGPTQMCIGGRMSHPSAAGSSDVWLLVNVDAASSRRLRISPEIGPLLGAREGRMVVPFSIEGWSDVRLSLPPDALELALEGQTRTARERLFFGAFDRCWPANGQNELTTEEGGVGR